MFWSFLQSAQSAKKERSVHKIHDGNPVHLLWRSTLFTFGYFSCRRQKHSMGRYRHQVLRWKLWSCWELHNTQSTRQPYYISSTIFENTMTYASVLHFRDSSCECNAIGRRIVEDSWFASSWDHCMLRRFGQYILEFGSKPTSLVTLMTLCSTEFASNRSTSSPSSFFYL